MAQPKRGLGRGLGALIPTGPPASASTPGAPVARAPIPGGESTPISGAYLDDIPVDAIVPNPRQPRQAFDDDALAELAASIEVVGLLQPVIVREVGVQRYELIMGERRWRACQLAGIAVIPAIVRQTSDDDLLRDALIENLHREQLNPLDEAAAYQQLLDDFGVTHEELAKRLGRSRPHISNTIRLLNLPPAVQKRVAAGVLSAGHARALLGVRGSGRPRAAGPADRGRGPVSPSCRGDSRARRAAGQRCPRTRSEGASGSRPQGPGGPAIRRLRDSCQSGARSAQGQDRGGVRLAGRPRANCAEHVAGAEPGPARLTR